MASHRCEQKDALRIESFSGQYHFLSNFYGIRVELGYVFYPSVENAFQAAKTFDPMAREPFRHVSPREAKRLGRALPLRPDWEDVKLNIMETLLWRKFVNPDLRAALLETGDAVLVEGNTWGDKFWGVCDGTGENHLGRLLMKVRAGVCAEPRVTPYFNEKHRLPYEPD